MTRTYAHIKIYFITANKCSGIVALIERNTGGNEMFLVDNFYCVTSALQSLRRSAETRPKSARRHFRNIFCLRKTGFWNILKYFTGQLGKPTNYFTRCLRGQLDGGCLSFFSVVKIIVVLIIIIIITSPMISTMIIINIICFNAVMNNVNCCESVHPSCSKQRDHHCRIIA